MVKRLEPHQRKGKDKELREKADLLSFTHDIPKDRLFHATDDPKTAEQWAVGIEKNRRALAGIFEGAGYEVQDYRHDGLYICKA